MKRLDDTLTRLRAEGNFRSIPAATAAGLLDFSTNDYLGLAGRADLRREFFDSLGDSIPALTSSASRLLAADQEEYSRLEACLESLYGRPALLFNSGYHANTGLVSALGDSRTLIAADKLVHASIIDGIRLSDATLRRWRHNDYAHLRRILAKEAAAFDRVLIIAESVYSMDGDRADLGELTAIRRATPGALLYIDEAHAVGVCGPCGLGLCAALPPADREAVDITVGTFGKALASVGAYAILGGSLRDFAVNRSRSFIFSTALPPLNCAWSRFVMERIGAMESERERLRILSGRLHDGLQRLGLSAYAEPSHIQPVMAGDARRALAMSAALLREGIKVLPIRTPTVPPGTERLRISLSAANTEADVDRLVDALSRL